MTAEPCTGAHSAAHWLRRAPHAIAVIEAGYRYTYSDLSTMVVRAVKFLSGSGLQPGAIAAIACGSRYMHMVLILACECLGVATTSLAPSELTPNNEILRRCTVLYSEEPCTWRHAVPLTLELIAAIARIPVTGDDLALLDAPPSPASGGRIVRTSGTTDQPKIMWNSPATIERMVMANRTMLDQLLVTEDFLCLYQFSIRTTYTHALLALRYGRTVVFSSLQDFQRDLGFIGTCHVVLLPAEAAGLCAMLPPLHRFGVRCGVHVNGSGVSAALRRGLLDTFASGVTNCYSMNETNYITWVDEDGVGTILPDACVRIVGEDGREVPMGETGRITVRSGRMVSGYLWNDELTARHFVNGWHITGDLGFQPAQDQLVVVGRADDMLNIGGVKLPPQPIEAAITAIDGISDAVLLGIENDQGLFELHVVIERSDPTRDADLDRQIQPIVHRYGRGYVGHFRDKLPRTDTGKVRRGALKALIGAYGN
jgi:acyl-CoA synthetase (AMP-forming)/AMP-acid ligase II